jgi:hypothetical protein
VLQDNDETRRIRVMQTIKQIPLDGLQPGGVG